jgi:hypothetical protein
MESNQTKPSVLTLKLSSEVMGILEKVHSINGEKHIETTAIVLISLGAIFFETYLSNLKEAVKQQGEKTVTDAIVLKVFSEMTNNNYGGKIECSQD